MDALELAFAVAVIAFMLSTIAIERLLGKQISSLRDELKERDGHRNEGGDSGDDGANGLGSVAEELLPL